MIAFPLHVDAHGATARTDEAGFLRDLIEQVLLTAPGERVNRPDFGAGLGQLLFAPTGPEVAATTRMLAMAALQQWLGELIDVTDVQVTSENATLVIEVTYTARVSRLPGTARLALDGGTG